MLDDTCSDCGSTEIIMDHNEGDLVCTNCGLVLGERMVESRPEMQLHIQLSNSSTMSTDLNGSNSQANVYLMNANRNVMKLERRMAFEQKRAEVARMKALEVAATQSGSEKRKCMFSESPTTPEVDDNTGKLVTPPEPQVRVAFSTAGTHNAKRAKVDIMAQVVKAERGACATIRDVAERLNVRDDITKESNILFKRLVTLLKINSGAITTETKVDKDLLKKVTIRFLCDPSTAMATIYTVCKGSMQPRSLKELCLACPEVKKKELGKKILFLQKLFAGNDVLQLAPVSRTGGHLVASYVDQHCVKFGISDDVATFAREVVQSCDDRKCLDGNPVSLAAAVLYVSIAASMRLNDDAGVMVEGVASEAEQFCKLKLELESKKAGIDIRDSLSLISVSKSAHAVRAMREVCGKCSLTKQTVDDALRRIQPALDTMFFSADRRKGILNSGL